MLRKKPVDAKTVRLLMPQWQGGISSRSYPLGARLLAWLAPESDAPLLEVPIASYDPASIAMEDGIMGRTAILRQLRAARHLLDAYEPDRVITFGGDCLVSQAPFAYLNERYDGTVGVLWIDAHPDVSTPEKVCNAHAMVLGTLLGEGDPGLAKEVRRPIDPKRVLLAGIDDMLDYEREVVDRLGIPSVDSATLAETSDPVLAWIRNNDITHLAIHFDLDVLDPKCFRSQLFNNPDADTVIDAMQGRLTMPQATRVITDAAQAADVVGFTFAEHMPWDDINLAAMMDAFSFMK
ncbi:MAG: arginase family protein [Planctomycetaceae bacterium]|nr:arginase family protein [Planctomycetaceae bacterium]